MYLEYFGLAEPPFRITPRAAFFFPGANRGATLEALIYAITHDDGFVKVSGAVGSGKTMLCRVLMKRLPAHVSIVHLTNPTLSPEEIQSAVISGLGLAIPEPANGESIRRCLREHLEALHAQGRRAVVLIDEAHAVPAETLDEIRRLSSLESNQRRLLQLVLFGQPELNDILTRPDMRLLRERITHNFTLAPLEPAEVAQYLDFRMNTAGYRGPEVFSPAAIGLLAATSLGLPRRINILADKALLAACAAGKRPITRKEVKAAIRDSEFAATVRKSSRRQQLLAGGMAAGILVVAALVWRGGQEAPPAPAAVRAESPLAMPAAEPAQAAAPMPAAATAVATSPTAIAGTPTAAPVSATANIGTKPTHVHSHWPELGPVTHQLVDKGETWLDDAPGERWFIQLIRLDTNEAARTEAITAKASQLLESDRLRAYAIEREGTRRIGLIYGDYASYADAAAAIDKLPAEMKSLLPYPRQVMRLR